MEHYKEIDVPARKSIVVDHTTCDLCGCKMGDLGRFEHDEVTMEVRRARGHFKEIKIKREDGMVFPDGGSGERTSFDICGKCFVEKLIPWFASQGAKPTVEDWDW